MMKKATAFILSVFFLFAGLNTSYAAEAGRKLSFKGVSLSGDERTVLNNLKNVGFEVISSNGSYYKLRGAYFRGKTVEISLQCWEGKVARLTIDDKWHDLFKGLVTKYGNPNEHAKRRYAEVYLWTFDDGRIVKTLTRGDSYSPIEFETAYCIELQQRAAQEEARRKQREADVL